MGKQHYVLYLKRNLIESRAEIRIQGHQAVVSCSAISATMLRLL